MQRNYLQYSGASSISSHARKRSGEGKLSTGQMIVFVPEDGGIPPGIYRIGTQTTLALLGSVGVDPHDPLIYERYFEQFYQYVDLDERKVQAIRKTFDYPEVTRAF